MDHAEPRAVDVLIVGAGLAGLSCAQALSDRGVRVTVIDQARGVGGRLATWQALEELPLDYGAVFLHGDDETFLDALRSAQGLTLLPGWPHRRSGLGPPCQTTAFAPRERRFGIAEGVSAWPEHLARDLDVRLGACASALELSGDCLQVHLESGQAMGAPTVVLALAGEQSQGLLDRWTDAPAPVDGARHLLRMVGSSACLTVMATYPRDVPAPSWDILYPSDSLMVQLISHETSKRPDASQLGLVIQARAGWSRAHLDDERASWSGALLAEAARLEAPWLARPSWSRPHRWRFGRTDLSTELGGPMLMDLGGGARLGLAGELFARGAGAEAAWLSGRALADRIVNGE